MRRAASLVLMLLSLPVAAPLWAAELTPYIGYIYPAGAGVGATVQTSIGGRNLGGVRGVYVSGEGLRVTVTGHYRPLGPGDIQAVMEHMRARTQQLQGRAAAGQRRNKPDAAAKPAEMPPLPDHPLVRGIDTMTLAQLAALRDRLQDSKQQPRPQLAETVTLQVSVDAGAIPGDRELRLLTPTGLSNPVLFQVGPWPEIVEVETPLVPRGMRRALPQTPPVPPAQLPVTLNGQILSGDTDRFPFAARQGQELVVTVAARRLVPYIADAVPGWFQAVVALYDPAGQEVAFADDYRYDPDPVLHYRVPADGTYALEIRDSIYRGRDDFVYRVAVAEQPFVTSLFPLGGAAGQTLSAAVEGWNLPWSQVSLDTAPGDPRRRAIWQVDSASTNSVPYAVDTLRELAEKEPNGDAPQDVPWPAIINGRIATPGDTDAFTFRGHAGEEVVAEVLARRLGSPLDSLLRVTDAGGKVLASNDDTEDAASALQTHHADSYLRYALPADGLYTVRLSDTTGAGSSAHVYRLRLSAPRPDFALRVTPAGLNIPAGRCAMVTAHVVRYDGFTGPVELYLVGAPAGYELSGACIPAGEDHACFTISGPPGGAGVPISIRIEGAAQIGGESVTREAVPAEDMMQAFAYRHLVPARELLATVIGDRRAPVALSWRAPQPLTLPAGGEIMMSVLIRRPPALAQVPVEFELAAAPAGVSLGEVKATAQSATLILRSDAVAGGRGAGGNVIVEAFATVPPRENRPGRKGQRLSLGALPALTLEVGPPG